MSKSSAKKPEPVEPVFPCTMYRQPAGAVHVQSVSVDNLVQYEKWAGDGWSLMFPDVPE